MPFHLSLLPHSTPSFNLKGSLWWISASVLFSVCVACWQCQFTSICSMKIDGQNDKIDRRRHTARLDLGVIYISQRHINWLFWNCITVDTHLFTEKLEKVWLQLCVNTVDKWTSVNIHFVCCHVNLISVDVTRPSVPSVYRLSDTAFSSDIDQVPESCRGRVFPWWSQLNPSFVLTVQVQ